MTMEGSRVIAHVVPNERGGEGGRCTGSFEAVIARGFVVRSTQACKMVLSGWVWREEK